MTDFRIVVKIDPTGVITGGRVVQQELRSISNAARFTQNSLFRAFSIFAGVSVLTHAVSTMANFSQAISTVEAVSKATGTELTALESKAKQLGATTRFTATQVAEGMVFLARTGFDAAQVLETISPALFLAQAGALELSRAADIATNVLKAFRLEVDQMNRVVDVLAAGANSANTNVEQFGQALKFVAPIAAGMNIELEQSAASLQVLADNAFKAELGGTGLRRVLSELESPTGRAVKILRQLGVTAGEIQVSQVGLVTSLTKLRDAGITTGQALDFFGKRGGPAFEILANNIPNIVRFTEELGNAEGAAEELSKVMDDNLNGALLQVKSAYEAFILALDLEPTLREAFFDLADAIRFLANNLDTAGVAALALVLALTGGPILRVVGIITGITGATFTLAGALGAAATAARLLMRALVIGLVIEGIILLVDKFQELDEIVSNTGVTWRQAGAFAVEEFANAVVGGLVALNTIVSSILLGLLRGFINSLVGIGEIIKTFADDPSLIISLQSAESWQAMGKLLGTRFTDGFNFQLDAGLREAQEDFNKQWFKFLGDDDARNILDKGVGVTGVLGTTVDIRSKPVAPVGGRPGFGGGGEPTGGLTKAQLAIRDFNSALEQQIKLSKLANVERTASAKVFDLVNKLAKDGVIITEEQTQALIASTEASLRQIEANDRMVALRREIIGPQEDYMKQLEAINALQDEGTISINQFNTALRETQLRMLEATIQAGEGGFADGFLLELGRMTQGVNNFGSSMGQIFGNVADSLTSNLSNALAGAIVGTRDLGEALKEVATSAISQLLASLIKLGLQYVINAAIGTALGAAATAAAVGEAAIVGAAWAPAAAFASLATLGANSVPAAAAIASTVALSSGLAAVTAALPGFATGGSFMVGGAGGTDSQVVSFRASPDERVTIETPGQRKRNRGGGGTNISFAIDARGAEIGVEERIREALAVAAPLIIDAARQGSISDTTELLQRRRL